MKILKTSKRNSMMAILATTVFLLSMLIPALSINTASAVEDSSWYKTVPGVLASDYYSLYPYETNASLNIGFSKWGELINLNDNTGLEFGAVDPFAPPAGSGIASTIPRNLWLQGWFINISYVNRFFGARSVWATAITSDGVASGGDWIRVDYLNDRSTVYGQANNAYQEDPRSPGSNIYGPGAYNPTPSTYGGRKTNGTAQTDPITVLYDGPREFIAICRTTIWDHVVYQSNDTTGDVPLVQIAITIVFNKDLKEVNLFKDVKSLLPLKEGDLMNIQFSNRGEIDLGTEDSYYASYAHFYTVGTANFKAPGNEGQNDTTVESLPTVYNSSYTLVRTAAPSVTTASGQYPQNTLMATIDVAQAISTGSGSVWSAAFWPSLSDWSIDGWDQWWQSLMAYDPHYIDLRKPYGEALVPFYIGEWDFTLFYVGDTLNRTQFRGVTGYGVTYKHDANDADMGGANIIDSEMLYYWNQKFMPWDLSLGAGKRTQRWVEYTTATTWTSKYAPAVYVSNTYWDDYNTFSERVELLGSTQATSKLLHRSTFNLEYNASQTSNGNLTLTGLPTGTKKIMYSTLPYWSIGSMDATGTGTVTALNVTNLDGAVYNVVGSGSLPVGPLGVTKAFSYNIPVEIELLNTEGNFTNSVIPLRFDDSKANFVVNKEAPFIQYLYGYDDETSENANYEATSPGVSGVPKVTWTVTNPNLEPVGMYLNTQLVLTISVTFLYNNTDGSVMKYNITITPTMHVFGEIENQWGRYEEAEVGRDAATIDSAGLAMVTEAFNSYMYVYSGIGASDMSSATVANSMPSIMSKLPIGNTGNSSADYKDAPVATRGATFNMPGFRAALQDDWCTYWPITSANIIGVGGPLANMLLYYTNDWTSALYGLPQFSGSIYSGAIAPVSCWNRGWPTSYQPMAPEVLTPFNTYKNPADDSVGYAVISSTIDINATEFFTVWGNYGRDTYYAAQWLHGDVARGIRPGILDLASMGRGVTSIVLKIYYTNPRHPTFCVEESLGTMTEINWKPLCFDNIHDP